MTKKELGRIIRHKRLRNKIMGTKECPRLCVYKSLKHLHAQLIDDIKGATLLSISTAQPEFKKTHALPDGRQAIGGNIKAANILGENFAALAKKKGVEQVVFDRAGFKFHGRIKAFAEAARKGGLKF